MNANDLEINRQVQQSGLGGGQYGQYIRYSKWNFYKGRKSKGQKSEEMQGYLPYHQDKDYRGNDRDSKTIILET